MAIPYQTAKFKSANILAIAMLNHQIYFMPIFPAIWYIMTGNSISTNTRLHLKLLLLFHC